jgi:STIM1 Orai1-activating region
LSWNFIFGRLTTLNLLISEVNELRRKNSCKQRRKRYEIPFLIPIKNLRKKIILPSKKKIILPVGKCFSSSGNFFFQCEKLHKKQQGVFGPFRVAHGSQLDTVDDGLVVAK